MKRIDCGATICFMLKKRIDLLGHETTERITYNDFKKMVEAFNVWAEKNKGRKKFVLFHLT